MYIIECIHLEFITSLICVYSFGVALALKRDEIVRQVLYLTLC